MSDLIAGKDAPDFRVVTGPCAAVEHQLNQLLKDYVANQFYWSVIDNQVHLSCLLMHVRIVNRAQLAAITPPGRRQ